MQWEIWEVFGLKYIFRWNNLTNATQINYQMNPHHTIAMVEKYQHRHNLIKGELKVQSHFYLFVHNIYGKLFGF